MSNIPALAIQQANDAVPGTVPRIPGANKVLVSDSTGSASAWADPAGLIGAGTLPAPALIATSNIALSGLVTVDGTASNSVTGDVLCVSQTAPDQNGYWTPSGSGAWGRPSYFNSNAQVAAQRGLSSGNATSGVRNIGSQWYLKSGTTLAGAKSYAKVSTQDLKVVDLSQAPYFVQTDTPVDQAPKIRQAIRDYAGSAPGKGAILQIPTPKDYVYFLTNIVAIDWSNIHLRGPGRSGRMLCGGFLQGGQLIAASMHAPLTVFGTRVDTLCDSPLVMYDASGGVNTQPFFNLTHGGFTWNGRATCHVTLRYRWTDLTLQGYVVSTRGREMFGDSLDECFRIQALADGSLVAKLRIGGVIKTCTKAAGTVVINTIYRIDVTFDGTTMKLYCAVPGAAKDAAPATSAATGSITDFAWEETHLGCQQNEDFPVSSVGASQANGVFGSLKITTAVLPIPSTTDGATLVSSAPSDAPGDFWFGPDSALAIMTPASRSDGSDPITPTALAYTTALGGGTSYGRLLARRAGTQPYSGSYTSGFMERVTVTDMLIDGGGAGSGIWMGTCKNARIDNVQVINATDGIYVAINSYYSHISNIEINASRVPLMCQNTGDITLSGSIVLISGGAKSYWYVDNNCSVDQTGVMSFEINAGRAVMLLKSVSSSRFRGLSLDDEGSGATMGRGVIVASVTDTGFLSTQGVGSLQNPHTTFVFGSDGDRIHGVWHNGMRHGTAAGAAYVVNILDTHVTPMVLLPDYKLLSAGPAAFSNQPGFVRDYNAPALPGAALTNVDSTILYSAGDTRPIAGVVATANRSTTLSATGARLGQKWAFPISAAQGFTWAFINGGGGGGTMFTAATTYIGTPEFIFDGTNWKLYRC